MRKLWGLGVIGEGMVNGVKGGRMVIELDVKLLDVLICILELMISERVILRASVWGDQLMVWLRNRTHVLVFDTRGTLTR